MEIIGGSMTVKELQERLSELDEKIPVVVYSEDESGQHLFEIDDVCLTTGTPARLDDGKAAFKFERDGLASWLFVTVSAA
jgi:hypothetical protein